MIKPTERDIRLAEEGVEKLAEATGLNPQFIVEIIRNGMELNALMYTDYFNDFMDELASGFDTVADVT